MKAVFIFHSLRQLLPAFFFAKFDLLLIVPRFVRFRRTLKMTLGWKCSSVNVARAKFQPAH